VSPATNVDNAALAKYVRWALQVGMVLSFGLLLVGLAWFMLAPGDLSPVLGPAQAIDALLNGDPIGLISLGIVILIATPLLALLASMMVFVQRRDWRFVLVDLAVLVVIIAAILVKG
jgi:uncharacterized membrane protein